MTRNQKPTGRAASMPAGLLSGTAVSVVITILGTAVIAKLLDSGTMNEEMVGYAVMVMLMAAAFIGAVVSRSRIKRQHMLVCILTGALYFITLLGITALFFGGQYEAVGVTGLLVMGGSILALLSGNSNNKAGKRRRTVRVNR